MGPMKPGGACLQLSLPVSVLDSCRQLAEGSQLQLEGSSRKKGNKKCEKVQLYSECRKEHVSFFMQAKCMGSIFKQKLSHFWHCEVEPLDAAGKVVCEDAKTPAHPTRGRKTRKATGDTLGLRRSRKPKHGAVALQSTKPLDGTVDVVKVEVPSTEAVEVAEPECEDDVHSASGPNEPAGQPDAASGTAIEGLLSSVLSPDCQVGTGSIARLDPCDISTIKQELDTLEGSDTKGQKSSLIDVITSSSSQGVQLPPTQAREGMAPKSKTKNLVKLRSQRTKRRRIKAPELAKDVDVSSLVCKFCNRSWFLSHTAYLRHFRTCYKNPENQGADIQSKPKSSFTCNVCFMTVPTEATLNRHLRDVHNIRRPRRERKPRQYRSRPEGYTCMFCGVQYPHRTSCRNHERYRCHANPERMDLSFCYLCTEKFSTRDQLKQHMAEAHADVKFVCDGCGLVFRSRGGLYLHMVKHHDDTKKGNFPCNLCERTFYTSKELNQHLDKHSDKRKYICDECGKSYKYSNHLYRHKATIHLNKFPYRCHICGHGVEKRSYLDAHICGRVRRGRTKSQSMLKGGAQDVPVKSEVIEYLYSADRGKSEVTEYSEPVDHGRSEVVECRETGDQGGIEQSQHDIIEQGDHTIEVQREAVTDQSHQVLVQPDLEQGDHAVLQASEIIVGTSQEIVTEEGEVYDINVFNLTDCDVYQIQN